MGEDEPPHADNYKVNPLAAFILISFLLTSGCTSILPRTYNDPLTAEEHNNLGVIYEREGKYELALKEYEKAADKDGSLVVPIVNTGNVYFKLAEHEKAEKSYRKALEKDNRNIEAANNLASLYLEEGRNYEEGLNNLKVATENLDTVPAYALDTTGVLYFRLGDKDSAMDSLSAACENARDNVKLKSEIESHLKDVDQSSSCR